ncbi:hypothetical protein [uncultured Serinicoccus sp.]|uniref:hypothetical protein n=1 Tax=uncultured Serinicoccus sp. TaxID=735514 RepID=UPI00261B67FB|nr:hypothetical protein [uncultured Serinicoccus sp.]
MSLPRLTLRPPVHLLTVLLATLALVLASLLVVPAASALEDDAAQTSQPAPIEDEGTQTPTDERTPEDAVVQALPAEDFAVEYVGPECWDSSYNVYVEYAGDDTDLRLVLQEEVDGSWVTIETERFYDGSAGIYSDWLEEGEVATFQVLVYDRTAPEEQTLLHGPLAVTGVSTEDCEDDFFGALPEEEWTLAEAGCGSVTFTSRADEEVAVIYGDPDAEDFEDYFFLDPGASATIETSGELVYWVSATGLDENLEFFGDVLLAGEGEVEVEQDCAPEPGEPTTPGQPAPGQPGDGGHQIPGTVQTDGGADPLAMSLGLGLALLSLAGLGLAHRGA